MNGNTVAAVLFVVFGVAVLGSQSVSDRQRQRRHVEAIAALHVSSCTTTIPKTDSTRLGGG